MSPGVIILIIKVSLTQVQLNLDKAQSFTSDRDIPSQVSHIVGVCPIVSLKYSTVEEIY